MAGISEVEEDFEGNSSSFWTIPSDDGFRFSNLSASHMSVLGESGPFVAIVLSYWDNVLGPRLQHVWRGTGDTESQVKEVIYHCLCCTYLFSLYTVKLCDLAIVGNVLLLLLLLLLLHCALFARTKIIKWIISLKRLW